MLSLYLDVPSQPINVPSETPAIIHVMNTGGTLGLSILQKTHPYLNTKLAVLTSILYKSKIN